MMYKFHINDFEGPLDLLLHLIKVNENKVAVYPVDIAPNEVKISDDNALLLVKGEKNKIYTLK